MLSVAVARLDGRIVRDLVSADGKGFLKGLGLWFALAVPSTYTNVMVSSELCGVLAGTDFLLVDPAPSIPALVEATDTVDPVHR